MYQFKIENLVDKRNYFIINSSLFLHAQELVFFLRESFGLEESTITPGVSIDDILYMCSNKQSGN